VADDAELENGREMYPIQMTLADRVIATPVDPFLDASSRASSPYGPDRERERCR
jgi:hypothetical protein